MNDSYELVFIEEANEHLQELESSLLELEYDPDDQELINKIFRSLHTIKGSGAMFGFDDISSFTHEIESVYDKVREGKLKVTKEIINLTLSARDQIKAMLNKTASEDDAQKKNDIITSLNNITSKHKSDTKKIEKEDRAFSQENIQRDISGENMTYRIRFKPHKDIISTGTNLIMLLDELSSFGECKIVAQVDEIPPIEDINPEYCYTYWDIILTTNRDINAIKDVFIFVEDMCELDITTIESVAVKDDGEDYKRVGEILIERGDIKREDLDTALTEKKYIGEILVEKGLVPPDKIESALMEQQYIREKRQRQKEDVQSSIKVAADKLDKLVNLVGELVTVQARLTQTVSGFNVPELELIAEEVERLTVEMRDNTLNMRMLPIGTTFGRFKRLVRDLSNELEKDIEMTTEGADTELDKTVIERINDPLIHLIRNAIDHGIEPPNIRELVGKPRKGKIHLSAVHSGGNVVIRIQDDGKGIDKEKVLKKAIEKGLINSNADISEKEVFNFIFHPGFSTAEEVTSLSGRGVGMDVVKKAVEGLRGSIDITSMVDKGTTVSISLPLTLAIVEGLLVSIGESYFIIPLSLVQECIELTKDDVKKTHGRNIAYVRGEFIPYVRLRNEFKIGGHRPEIEQIVVISANGQRIGFVVDAVIGEHQTVIKNLGRLYKDVEGISGATILGNGTVALIIDVLKIINNIELADAVFN